MKWILSLFLALSVAGAQAAGTDMFLHKATTDITCTDDGTVARTMNTTVGTSTGSVTKATSAGTVTPPTTGTQWTVDTAGGLITTWVSLPVNGPVTLSASATIFTWALESSSGANCTLTGEILHLNGNGTVLAVIGAVNSTNTELLTSSTQKTWTVSLSNTVLGSGDRIGFRPHIDDAFGLTMGAGAYARLYMDGPTAGANGYTYIHFQETIDFLSAPTATMTYTVSVTKTVTQSLTFTPTATPTFTWTPTSTVTPTSTWSPTVTPTWTPTYTSTVTPTFTITLTPTPDPKVMTCSRFATLTSATDSTVAANNGNVAVTTAGNRMFICSATIKTASTTTHQVTIMEDLTRAAEVVTVDADFAPSITIPIMRWLDPGSKIGFKTSADITTNDIVSFSIGEIVANSGLYIWAPTLTPTP